MKEGKFDIGVLGWWYGENYGSMLTYYALNRTLEKMGYSVLMIHENLGYNGWRVHWDTNIAPMEFARRVGYHYTEQIHFEEAGSLNEKCQSFMVGSDQLWNPLIGRVNDDLFLDFVEDNKPRYAYGTSFGNRDIEKFSPEFIEKHTKDLQKFEAISVREEYAVDIAKNIFKVDAIQVVDPVFLLSQSDYGELAKTATYKAEGRYLAAFILDPNEEKRRVIDEVAEKLELDKIVILANPEDRNGALAIFNDSKYEIVEENKPENWLYTYQHASYVVTDSFHGSCFAYMFQKPFSSFYNQKRGADRFISLMNLFGFESDRRIEETDTRESIFENSNVTFEIDYSEAIQRVDLFAASSRKWLTEVLDRKLGKGTHKTENDLFEKVQRLEYENRILKQSIAILSQNYIENGD